ncbi:MAG: GerW family sporulation protein [Clostridiales bacterium]|jgi:sporulation protein YtfJ|uniref:GerW family sporulation protein n=1 Tax=Caproicibacterium sp. BJN0003 TaxID=2994078 RepID=UPI002257534B|nr:GerW family sporulation protein [Caproicibacterium sp. BJN0003]MCI1951247.1 GerW family sporulation protein [Clostridiales bacterium]MCI2161700.1 GerW family sporulation protein [Oscillospiraceae bacterium]MCI1960424.1 GerW family sporulation protein [Clostridiales bacterium]MCI2020911.1 GerW family sporulation protein [Clostridiales bacterium]MCI2025294.1 GerW family sporulation protein [Clostridiales bacterium]
MSEHPIEGLMGTTLEKIKQMVDINTIIGDPITSPDGTIIIPVSKISYGFASGGSDFASKVQTDKSFFGGGAGAGVTISPIAFITISNGNVKMLQIDPYNSSADRIVGMVPDVVDKISSFVKESKEKKEAKKEKASEENPIEDPQV